MARSSVMVTMDIAMVETDNTANQRGVTDCTAKLNQLQDRIDTLGAKKAILDSTYSIYDNLNTYISTHLDSLDETSVCIAEIKTEAKGQISEKIGGALKMLGILIGNLESAISTANTEYSTTYGQLQTYKTNLANGQQRLGTLETELEQAKAAELPVM